MSYAPGITYQGGELLGQGIRQAGAGIAQGLQDYFAKRDAAEQLRAYLAGPKAADPLAAYTEGGVGPTTGGRPNADFGGGIPEGSNEGTGEGDATEQEKKVHKLTKALRDIGEHGYGYSRPVVESMGFNELTGDRKSTRLNSSHTDISRMPSSA